MKRLALDVTKTFNSCWNWLWSSDFHKQFYLHKLFTTHFIFYLFRALHQVAYSTYLHLFHLFSFFNNQMTKLKYCYSHPKSFIFMFWIVLLMFLIIWTSHTLQIHFFHPTSFFSSLTQSLISFKSYTASCITNLDNSVNPFHFPCSSLHTPCQSAFRMLCNTIHASFSTKKCT